MNIEYKNIELKEFSVVGLRHNEGENAFVMSKTGIMSVENNNIVLKTTNGSIVGSMVSSTKKIEELRSLGIKEEALTSQGVMADKGVDKNIFDGAIVELQQYIPNVCVVVKIIGRKKKNTVLRTSEVLKAYVEVDGQIFSLSRFGFCINKSKQKEFTVKDGMTVLDVNEIHEDEEKSSSQEYEDLLLSNEVDNRLRFMLEETSSAKDFHIDDMVRVFERCRNPNLGIIQTLAKIMAMTSLKTINDEPIKYNLEKVDFIYSLLSDVIGEENIGKGLNKKGETARSLLWG